MCSTIPTDNRCPQVSIIVPIYNVEKYIERCVRSLFEQTMGRVEYIFVNDCSTDRSVDVLHRVMREYPHRVDLVKIINHKTNKGVASARNTGLCHATSKYIGWVDGDDWIELNMFETLYEVSEQNNADIVWCDFYIATHDTEAVKSHSVEEDKYAYMRSIIAGKIAGMLWNKLMKRSLFTAHEIAFLNGQDVGEDENVLIKLLYFSNTIKYVPKVLYHYAQWNPISLTHRYDSFRIFSEIANAKGVLDFLSRQNASWISSNYWVSYKLQKKRRLLFSLYLDEILQWRDVFPECNMWVFGCKHIGVRHKIIAVIIMLRLTFLIKIWLCLKNKYGQINSNVK